MTLRDIYSSETLFRFVGFGRTFCEYIEESDKLSHTFLSTVKNELQVFTLIASRLPQIKREHEYKDIHVNIDLKADIDKLYIKGYEIKYSISCTFSNKNSNPSDTKTDVNDIISKIIKIYAAFKRFLIVYDDKSYIMREYALEYFQDTYNDCLADDCFELIFSIHQYLK